MTEQTCKRDNGNSIHPEDQARLKIGRLRRNTDGYEDQQEVYIAGQNDGLGRVPEAH